MIDFCDTFNFINLIKVPTCYKSVLKPTSIDVILTNRNKSFENSHTIDTGISDYHKMTVTVLKTFFKKNKPTIIKYREYKKIDVILFKSELVQSLRENDAGNMNDDKFRYLFMTVLDKHDPLKEIRGNNAPFMNKTLSKAFMERSKRKNKYSRYPREENK